MPPVRTSIVACPRTGQIRSSVTRIARMQAVPTQPSAETAHAGQGRLALPTHRAASTPVAMAAMPGR